MKKEIFSVQNWKETFWETALCSVNSSHRVTSFTSRSLSLRLFLWNWQRDIWKPIEGYGEKGNIFRSKLERGFLGNCAVFCEFISQNYSFPLQKPFAETAPVEFVKGYLEAHWGLWWKRKYPQMKNEKKVSEKRLCDVWLPLTDLQLYFVELFASLISMESENWHFGSLWRLQGQRKYPLIKMRKKLFEELLYYLWIHLPMLQFNPQKAFR